MRLLGDVPTTEMTLLHLHRRFGRKCPGGESIVSLIASEEGSLLGYGGMEVILGAKLDFRGTGFLLLFFTSFTLIVDRELGFLF